MMTQPWTTTTRPSRGSAAMPKLSPAVVISACASAGAYLGARVALRWRCRHWQRQLEYWQGQLDIERDRATTITVETILQQAAGRIAQEADLAHDEATLDQLWAFLKGQP